jgi:hypothetical protein
MYTLFCITIVTPRRVFRVQHNSTTYRLYAMLLAVMRHTHHTYRLTEGVCKGSDHTRSRVVKHLASHVIDPHKLTEK